MVKGKLQADQPTDMVNNHGGQQWGWETFNRVKEEMGWEGQSPWLWPDSSPWRSWNNSGTSKPWGNDKGCFWSLHPVLGSPWASKAVAAGTWQGGTGRVLRLPLSKQTHRACEVLISQVQRLVLCLLHNLLPRSPPPALCVCTSTLHVLCPTSL